MDSALVAPYESTVVSVAEQIENEWFPNYAAESPKASWSSSDTLFAIFDGINDVGNSWWKNNTVTNTAIYAVYRGLVEELYQAGARNFAFLNVPPVDRSPLALGNTPSQQYSELEDIWAWNNATIIMTHRMKEDRPDINIFIIDTNKVFTQVLDNPASYPQTALYKNTTAFCTAYEK